MKSVVFINAFRSVRCGTPSENEGSETPLGNAPILLAFRKAAVEAPNMYQ